MCEGALLFGIFGLMSRLGGMAAPPGGDVLMGGIAPYGTYVTKDGRAVALGALEPKFWLSFCAAVGLPGDLSALAPGPHQAEWKRRVADVFASRTRDEWAAFAAEHDCCLEPVLDPEELPADPQHRARRMFLYAERPSGAPLPMPRTPVAPAPPDDRALPAPPQGAHTREVLREGGLADAEIDALVSAGAAR
jgi:crotonobetainyl-CoA:carnitine CoA-transferase CaiB-like acyl-CoA transferase